jgi:hypothetical protein
MFPLTRKDLIMMYKTICLQMIQDRPVLYDQLLKHRVLLPTLDHHANQLRTSHEAWVDRLSKRRAGSNESQIASEALEFALKEVEDRLSSGSPAEDSEACTLEGAMAFINRHSPPA